MATFDELKAKAKVIKNEILPAANTAGRVGELLEEMIDGTTQLGRETKGYILTAYIIYNSANNTISIAERYANIYFYISAANGTYYTFSGSGNYNLILESDTEYYIDTTSLSTRAFSSSDIIKRKITTFIDLSNKILLLRTNSLSQPIGGHIYNFLDKLIEDNGVLLDVATLKSELNDISAVVIDLAFGKNLFNKNSKSWKTCGYYYRGNWIEDTGFLATSLMSVDASETYCIFPHSSDIYNYYYCIDKDGKYLGNATVISDRTGANGYVVIKTSVNTAFLSLCMSNNNFNTYKSQIQVEKGHSPTIYEAYIGALYVNGSKVAGFTDLQDKEKEFAAQTEFIEKIQPVFIELLSGKNLFNKNAGSWKTDGYYDGSGNWIANAQFLATGLMKVKENNTYCISPQPSDIYNYCYCVDKNGNYLGHVTVISSITGTNGYKVIKTRLNTAYLSICMSNNNFNTYKAQVQVEEDSIPTSYEPYQSLEYVAAEKVVGLPKLQEQVDDLGSRIPKTTVKSVFTHPQYPGASGKFLNFREAMLKRDKDAIVVITGTSLSQGSTWASTRTDATTRPPVLHTNDFASAVYDKLIQYWVGQENRRYDHSFFTLIGSNWAVKNSDDAWDDNTPVHNGLTKLTSDANAGVSMVVPSDAFRFNFIYRSDSTGDTCTIAIAEGNGKMEVFDGTNWVEANGFQFSMLEPIVTSTKGNTCYQKRLNMRCKNRYSDTGINSIGSKKNVTIKKGNNTDKRFLLVGAEWSKREFMLQVINASRGFGAWAGSGVNANWKYQDSDIWIHNPTMLLAEITTHNWGANANGNESADPTTYLSLCKTWYFNAFNDQPYSLYAKTNGYTTCDVIFYNDTFNGHRNNNGPWDESGNIKWGTVSTEGDYMGVSKTCYENYDIVDEYVRSEQSQYAFVALNPNFKRVCEQVFGRFSDGLIASGMTGETLTTDGTHWNDNGAALVADVILPLFDFM